MNALPRWNRLHLPLVGLDWNSSAFATLAGVDRTMSLPTPRRLRLRRADRFRVGSAHDSSFRPELVRRVRQAIAAGAYDGESKFEAALDRLASRFED